MTKLDDVVEAAGVLLAGDRGASCPWCGMPKAQQTGLNVHARRCAFGALRLAWIEYKDACTDAAFARLNETDAVLALTEPEPEAGGSVRG